MGVGGMLAVCWWPPGCNGEPRRRGDGGGGIESGDHKGESGERGVARDWKEEDRGDVAF